MTISGVSSSDPISNSPSTAPTQALDKDAFLKLLVKQMQSQDPLSPSDSTQYVSQLAQFSSLEQMQNLNDNVVVLAALQQGNAVLSQLTQSSALIGKTIDWTDATTGDTHTGKVGAVKVVDGAAVLEVDGQDVPLASVTAIHDPSGTESTGGAGDTTSGSSGDSGTDGTSDA